MLKKKRVIFIWIPKTAGTSMFNIFKQYGAYRLKDPYSLRNFKNKGFLVTTHFDIFKLLSKGFISKEFFKKSFKFSFVRNPWDRLVSLYQYRRYLLGYKNFSQFVFELQKMAKNQNNLFFKIFNKSFDLFLYQSNLLYKNSNLIFYFHYLGLLKNIYFPIGLYNVFGLSQANPQYNWITNNKGDCVLDFLGRFENLNSDFNEICNILGIKEKLPHLRETKHSNYRKYYNKETKNIVKKIYEKDIKTFNYKF